jgi:hypothetical protein
MSALLILGFAAALASGGPQDQDPAGGRGERTCPTPGCPMPVPVPYPPTSAGRQASPVEPALSESPPSSRIGDEPGVLSGNGPIRHTPVPGVKFRTVAPGGSDPIEPEPESLTGRPVGQPAAAGLGTHVQRGEAPPPTGGTPPRTPD